MSAVATRAFPVAQGETLLRMERAHNYNRWLLDRGRRYLGRRVLDVGAGIGTFTAALAGRHELLALEPDPAFVPGLRERFADTASVEVQPVDLAAVHPESLPELFDSAVCFNVLEHVSDDGAALKQLGCLLKPRGTLLLLVPAHQALAGPLDEQVGHERRYGKRGLRSLLEQSGFEIEALRHVNPVGALGWLVAGRVLRRAQIPAAPLRAYDRLVPALKCLDGLRLPLGLSLWAVAHRAA